MFLQSSGEKSTEMLEAQVRQLERVNKKQAEKIAKLKSNTQVNPTVLKNDESANKIILSLNSELNMAKTLLEETRAREKQVLDWFSLLIMYLKNDKV